MKKSVKILIIIASVLFAFVLFAAIQSRISRMPDNYSDAEYVSAYYAYDKAIVRGAVGSYLDKAISTGRRLGESEGLSPEQRHKCAIALARFNADRFKTLRDNSLSDSEYSTNHKEYVLCMDVVAELGRQLEKVQ